MSVKFTSYDSGDSGEEQIWTSVAPGSQYQTARIWTVDTSHRCNSVFVKLRKIGVGLGTITVSIRAVNAGTGKPTGGDIVSATMASSAISTTATWYEFTFGAGTILAAATKYAIVVHGSQTGSGSNCITWRKYTVVTNARGYTSDGGTTWNLDSVAYIYQDWGDTYCTTAAATDLAAESVTGNGTTDVPGSIDEYGFDYGLISGTYTGSATIVGTPSASFSVPITGLQAATLYFFRAKVHHTTYGWLYASELYFITAHDDQTAQFEKQTTSDTTDWITYGNSWNCETFTPVIGHVIRSVKLKLKRLGSPTGLITIGIRLTDGAGKPTGGDLASATYPSYLISTTATTYEFGLGAGMVVQAGTKYAIVFRVAGGTSSNGINWRTGNNVYSRGQAVTSSNGGSTWTIQVGNDMVFEDWGDYGVETHDASNIEAFQATGNGLGYTGESYDEFGFDWGTSPGVYTGAVTEVATFSGLFSLDMTGLSHTTPYYYRAKAHFPTYGWIYGIEVSFTTLPPIPHVHTNPPSDVGTTFVVAQGEIISVGATASCDERGFVYGLTSKSKPGYSTAPAASGYTSFTTESDTYGIGEFSKLIEGLTGSKVYYIRAWAHNTYGYDYGEELIFFTNKNVNVLLPTADYSAGIRFDSSPGDGISKAGGGYPHIGQGTIPHYILMRSADTTFTPIYRWGVISGNYIYEYNYYNDNYYTDLYSLSNPTRRDVGVVKIKWKARAGKTLYPYGKYKRELYTHATQYSSAAGIPLGSLGWICEIFYTNPYTGAAWTIAELDALIAGITLGQEGGFGTAYADALRVYVLWANAEVQTKPATGLGGTQFRLRANIVEDEAEDCIVYFEYGATTSYGSVTSDQTGLSKGADFTADVDLGVSPIHFRAVIETPCGETFYGSDRIAPENDGIGGCFFKDYILSARTEIGWDEELQQASSGIAEFIVDNFNGDFNPENVAGVFSGQLALGVEITFSEVFQGVEYLHFTGKINKIVPNDDPNDPTAYILCLCGMDDLAAKKVTTALRTNTNVGDLAEDVLDAAGWPAADREIDSGIDTLDVGWFHKRPGLEAFRDLELTEKGRAWVKPNGFFRFENRHYRITGDGLVSKHDFENTAVRVEYEWSKRLLYNDVVVTGRRYFAGGVQLFSGYDMANIESSLIWSAHTGDSGAPYIPQNSTLTLWAETNSPIYSYDPLVKGTHWNANSAADKTGTDLSNNITITETQYGQAVKLVIVNAGGVGAYLVEPDSPPDPTETEDRTLLIYGVLFSAENVTIEEEDTASQALYGKKELPIDAPFKSKPNDILAYAQWLKQRYSIPIPNPVQLIHVARTNYPDTTIRVQCLARHISDRITFKSTKLGFDRDFYINKVIQEYVRNEGGMVHNTYWVVESAEGSAEELYWLLGVAGFGELGIATRLGF